MGGVGAAARALARCAAARFVATLITSAGTLTGQVPREVSEALNYGPFRDFCVCNVDAEKTAARCWSRISELAAADSSLPASLMPTSGAS